MAKKKEPRICKNDKCGEVFMPKSWNSKYCDTCVVDRVKHNNAEWAEKEKDRKRGPAKTLGDAHMKFTERGKISYYGHTDL